MEDSLWISNCRCEEEGAIKSGGASWKRRGLETLSESYLMCPWAITPSPNPLCSLRSPLDTLWLWLLWDVTVPEQRDSEIFPPRATILQPSSQASWPSARSQPSHCVVPWRALPGVIQPHCHHYAQAHPFPSTSSWSRLLVPFDICASRAEGIGTFT